MQSSLLPTLLFLLLSISALFTHASIIHTWHTPQGTKVLFTQTKGLPIVDIALNFDAASSRDSEDGSNNDKLGISALTNAMLGTHSKDHTESEIIEGFTAIGAQFSAHSFKDMSIVSLRVLSQSDILNPSIKLLAEVVAQPVFKQAILNRLKQQTQQGILAKKDSPASIASEAFANTLFGTHPYANPSSGNAISVANITIQAIQHHYKKYYVAKNLNIAIVGDVSLVQAKSIAKQLTHKLNIGQKAKPLVKVSVLKKSIDKHIDFKSLQSHLYIGTTGINRDHPDYYALYLANHIFGGSTLNSVLGEVIREKNGLAYSVYSYFQPMAANGIFAINLQTKNAQLSKASHLTFQTLNNFIVTGITTQTLQDAKDNIIGSFALRSASNAQIKTYLSLIGFYDLPLDYLSGFPNKIQALNVKIVQAAVNRFFSQAHWLTLSVGGKPKTIKPK